MNDFIKINNINKIIVTGIYNSKDKKYEINKIGHNKYLLNSECNGRKMIINSEVNMTHIEALFLEVFNHMVNKKIIMEIE